MAARSGSKGSCKAALIVSLSLTICLAADDRSATSVDWLVTTGQQACVATTEAVTSATLNLTNANVILYTYVLDLKSYEIATDDFAKVQGRFNDLKELRNPENCIIENLARTIRRVWNTEGLFPKPDTSFIPRSQTEIDLTAREVDYVAIFNCSDEIKKLNDVETENQAALILKMFPLYQKIRKDSKSEQPSVFAYQVDNKHYYVFGLFESSRWDGKRTKRSMHWRCGLDDVLTLSAGVMATTVPYRTYLGQNVPSGSSTANILVVNGNSRWSPQALALLNYKLFSLDEQARFNNLPLPIGFAFSTGPAFKFGGTPEVSNFGWFTGISISLWRRLFLTPGLHFGQFADFPTGFAQGNVVPPSFGQLTPTTRWTGRFAIGITFKANSFSRSDRNTPATVPK